MAKNTKTASVPIGANRGNKDKDKEKEKPKGKKTGKPLNQSSDYLWQMSEAGHIDKDYHLFQMLPAIFFVGFVILITRMVTYSRPMQQFYWYSGTDILTDFFSYGKMVAICICTVLALMMLLYRLFTQTLAIKRTSIYIPMGIYALLVVLSYAFSEYKEFAWLGWNDRFEGTVVLLGYMVFLFYIINTVNTEKSVKWILYPTAVTSTLLCFLGISQAMDKDFFRTAFGQKLITPNTMTDSGMTVHQLIDQAVAQGQLYLKFTFQDRQIYQTVYNINYVSFYLTLLIPLFGLLFIRSIMRGKEEPIWRKGLLGILFALLLFNIIGSASSGGYFGMAIVVLLAFILLNKTIIKWWKPVALLLVITVIIGGITYERWMPELTGSINAARPHSSMMPPGATNPVSETEQELKVDATGIQVPVKNPKGSLEYFVTEGNNIRMGYMGNELIFITDPEDFTNVTVTDGVGNQVNLKPLTPPFYRIDDPRFSTITMRAAQDESGNGYVLVGTDGDEWPFHVSKEGVLYVNGMGKLVALEKVPAVGWKNNQMFGSGRGYIWSRSIPMMEKTLLLGHGADTYCIFYPHNDYVGKYNSGTFSYVKDIIVDKPHNMYMGMWVGTGGLSVLAFLTMLLLYAIQSIKVIWRNPFEGFLDYTAAGLFLGIMGFAVTGFVDDSSVSVMPMFYGFLGIGIAVNMIILRDKKAGKPGL